MRNYSLLDHLCIKADHFIRFLSGNLLATQNLRENPAKNTTESLLTEQEKKEVSALMRVNYTGEVCAQALYQGQAFTTKNLDVKYKLEKAGLEEIDHLYWCQSRLHELNSHVSYLNPLWYAGSFLLGTLAGICGDKWNLGFLEETEKQVAHHLEEHLRRLPLHDEKTKKILEKMHEEEGHHAEVAREAGAEELPTPVKIAMKIVSKIMTKTAYWI